MKTISSTIATEILNILCCFFPNCFTVISLDINLFRVLGLPSLLHTIGFPHVALIHFSHLIFPGTVLPCTWFLNHLEPRPTVCADQAPHLGLIYYGDFCCRDEYFYNCPHKLPPLVCCPGRGRSSRGELRFLHCLRSPIKLLRHLVPQTVLTARAVQIPSQMGMGL